MPTIDTGEVLLHYNDSGSGTPIIFLHGFTLDWRMWRRQIEHFSTKFRTIAYDSRGHGKSDCPQTGYSRTHRVRDLQQLVKKLRLKKFHLVGLSMGGATALGYAIDFPKKLLSLTLVDSAAGGYKPSKKYKDFSDNARTLGVEEAKRRWIRITLFYYANRNPELRRELAEMMAGHCGHLWLDPMRGKYNDRDDLALAAEIKIPTMIFVGEKDRYFIPLAKKLHKMIENSEIDIVPGVGHMLNMEANDRFNFRLEQFLERVEAGK